MKKIAIKSLILIFSILIYSLDFCVECPPLNVILDGSVDKYFPLKSIDVDNLAKSMADMDKRNEISQSIEREYMKMWEDFENKGDVLPYCVFDAFNKLKKQKTEIYIHFTLSSWANPEYEPFLSGNQSCKGVVGEYFTDDMNVNKSPWRGLYIFCIWKKDYDGRYCTRAVIFHELLHYVLDQLKRKPEYIDIKKEFNVNIPIAPNTNFDNFYSDEAVVEDCELKVFGCGSDAYKHIEENYYKNGARRFNPPRHADCAECILCKKKPN